MNFGNSIPDTLGAYAKLATCQPNLEDYDDNNNRTATMPSTYPLRNQNRLGEITPEGLQAQAHRPRQQSQRSSSSSSNSAASSRRGRQHLLQSVSVAEMNEMSGSSFYSVNEEDEEEDSEEEDEKTKRWLLKLNANKGPSAPGPKRTVSPRRQAPVPPSLRELRCIREASSEDERSTRHTRTSKSNHSSRHNNSAHASKSNHSSKHNNSARQQQKAQPPQQKATELEPAMRSLRAAFRRSFHEDEPLMEADEDKIEIPVPVPQKTLPTKSLPTKQVMPAKDPPLAATIEDHDDDDDSSEASATEAMANMMAELVQMEKKVLHNPAAKTQSAAHKDFLKQMALFKLQLLDDGLSEADDIHSSWHSQSQRPAGASNRPRHMQGLSGSSNHSHKSRRSTGSGENSITGRSVGRGPAPDSGHARSVAMGRELRNRNAKEDKVFDNAGYQPDRVIPKGGGPRPWSSVGWSVFANLVTFPLPDACLFWKQGTAAKQAWREKMGILFILVLVSAIFVATVSLVPVLICTESEVYYDVGQVERFGWTTIFGVVYNLNAFVDKHPGEESLEPYIGADASSLFPRTPPGELPMYCLTDRFLNETYFNETNTKHGLNNATCNSAVDELLVWGEEACHTSIVGRDALNETLGKYKEGNIVIPRWELYPDGLVDGTQYVIIHGTIYNVTQYVNGLLMLNSALDPDHAENELAYLSAELHNIIMSHKNKDASMLFDDLFQGEIAQEAVKGCLDELFYHGEIDERYTPRCQRIAKGQYALAGILGFLIMVQVTCSLLYITRRPPMVRDEDKLAAIMVMVPCYNESEKELRKTIDSCLANDYPDENVVLVVVADGVITGRGEELSCPETLGEILGFKFDPNDEAQAYESVGARTTNYATVYSGVYKSPVQANSGLKYVVVVKQGCPDERGTPRAGNRGKRDSQLLLFGILNRIQYHRRPTELDLVFTNALNDLDLQPSDVEYLMAIDADTRVSRDSFKYFVHKMDHDESVLACCGETQVDNKSQSFITMIQVFEYYSAHHLKKAFESVFGCVTCLPGCFTMYRMYTTEFEPLLACDSIVNSYSRNDITSLHERNLYELGEDRMLTTLLLQEFHRMQLSFVPEAICWTVVPHTLQILKSQRRRWINSTLHNMCELLKVQTMCGICIFSMKMVVIFDLISTFLLPSGCVYLYYIVVEAAMSDDPLTPLQMLAFAYVALMTLPFVFRANWGYFYWFLLFLIGGIPAFYFYLPIYAIMNMDDLSWGKTRQVQAAETPDEKKSEEEGHSGTDMASLTDNGLRSDDERRNSLEAREVAEHKEAARLHRRRICFGACVVLLALIGGAFAVHHFVYDDVLFDYFRKD